MCAVRCGQCFACFATVTHKVPRLIDRMFRNCDTPRLDEALLGKLAEEEELTQPVFVKSIRCFIIYERTKSSNVICLNSEGGRIPTTHKARICASFLCVCCAGCVEVVRHTDCKVLRNPLTLCRGSRQRDSGCNGWPCLSFETDGWPRTLSNSQGSPET